MTTATNPNTAGRKKLSYRVIDVDAHLIEPAEMWPRYLEPAYREMAPREATNTVGRQCTVIGDHLAPFAISGIPIVDTPQIRLAAMDEEGFDAMIVYPTAGLLFGGLQRVDLWAALCRAHNDYAHDYCSTDPSRLFSPAMLPQLDVFECVKEARRGVAELGLKGVFMRPNPIGGRT